MVAGLISQLGGQVIMTVNGKQEGGGRRERVGGKRESVGGRRERVVEKIEKF